MYFGEKLIKQEQSNNHHPAPFATPIWKQRSHKFPSSSV